MSANLPINWTDKKNSPLLADFIAKYGSEYCMTAEEINQLRDAVNEMSEIQKTTFLGVAEPDDTPSGTGAGYWEVITPGTYTRFGSKVLGVDERGLIVRDTAGAFKLSKVPYSFSSYAKITDLEKLEFSNPQTIGSTAYDTPFSLVTGENYYLNNESFASDKYVSSIKGFANSSGNVYIVFGAVLNGKFVERKTFTFTNATSGLKTYTINDVLMQGEIYGLKMPSTGMAWVNVANNLGKMISTTGYNGNVASGDTVSLALELSISDFIKVGYTKFQEFDAFRTKVNEDVYKITFGTAIQNGSTVYDIPFNLIEQEQYWFNTENYPEDRYISKLEMFANSTGAVYFVFGSVVNNKFIERKSFAFTAVTNSVNSYFVNDILFKGEFIALKTPSVGMVWKNVADGLGKLANTTSYNGNVGYEPTLSLAMKVTSYADYTEIGDTPIDYFNGVKKRIDNINTVLKKIDDDSIITVGKLSGDFNTITDAINSIKTKTGKFIIHISSGIYEESIDLFKVNINLDLTFIGASKKDVTVLMRLGDYHKPPMQVFISSCFENITFKSTQELGLADPPSYAVHSDFGQNACLIEYFNCDFINYVGTSQAYGAGSWQGHTLRFRNCVFRKYNTATNSGTLFWHNKVPNNIFQQRLEVLYCEFYADGGPTLQLGDANQTSQGNTDPSLSQASVLFVGNTFKSGNLTANASFLRNETLRQTGALVGNIYLDESSHGNNISDLNF